MKTEIQQIRESLNLAILMLPKAWANAMETADAETVKKVEADIQEVKQALEALTTLEQEYVTGVDLIKWLALPHDVSISTKQRSDYWANQFKVAHEQAVKLIADAMEGE